MAEKRRPGRPSRYSKALATEICGRMAEGETLTDICREEGMPSRETVRRWQDKHEGFSGVYTRAREMQADHYADMIIAIAHDGSKDLVERQKRGETVKVVDQDHIQRDRLKVDALKWISSKMAPKSYGDRLQHTGEGQGSITLEWVLPPAPEGAKPDRFGSPADKPGEEKPQPPPPPDEPSEE